MDESTLSFSQKLVLPFSKFGRVFNYSKLYERIVMILQCILIGCGPLLFGQIEVGLIMFVLIWGLGIGFGFISSLFFSKALLVTTFSYIVVALILVAAVIALIYITFSRTVALAEKRLQNESTFNSFIFNGVSKLVISIKDWIVEFKVQFQAGDKKVKTLLPLSFFTCGIPLFVFGEYVKGVALFGVQALGIFYMIARGAADFNVFLHLKVSDSYNSAIVYGVIALAVILLFIFFYVVSIKQTLKAAREYNERRLGTHFKKQLYELIDKNFYITSLIIPVLGAIVFTVLPLTFMIISAFTNYSNVTAPGYSTTATDGFLNWTGFESFRRVFANNANFTDLISVFAWTMIWALLATFTCFFGGLLLAMLINKKSIKCKALFRSIFVVSMAMPQFVSLLVMRTFFENYGPLQTLLSQLGIVSMTQPMDLWKTEFTAKMLIIFINMWVGIPYYMLLMSGLLINIPKGYYEAARISGASKWQQFRRITFPNIMFMTAPMLITSFVSNINNFNVIWFLTAGEPASDAISSTAGKTDILITWLYKLTMRKQDYNFGAAIGIIMFAITATLSLVIFHRSSSYKNEEEYR